jgi:hypothetical protein
MRCVRLAILAILGLILVALPAVAGCGGETAAGTVVVGSLADFSGQAAFAVLPTVAAVEESFAFYQEKDPIPGLTVEFIEYDHQLNYSKTVEGYQDLKARGMNLLYAMGPTEREMLSTYVEEDHMPVLGSQPTESSLDFPWIFNITTAQTWQGEIPMQSIADTWDYAKDGVPVIGHQGWTLTSTTEIQKGIDVVLNDAAYAGKFNWVGLDKATMTNVTWSTSYEKFKDCDFIYVSTVGNSLATFVSQMRSLGYKGAFMSSGDSFAGYWQLVQARTAADQLYDCYYPWWGPIAGSDSDADWYQEMLETTQANHPDDWQKRVASTGPLTGWLSGRVLYQSLKNAAKKVGADKLDGDAIKAGFDAVSIKFEDTGNTFTFSDEIHTGLRTSRILGWDVATSSWKQTNDKWYTPLSIEE